MSQNNDDIETLNTPLLVMHSPVDSIVAIEQAEHIYRRAKHPKSFISLDTADHLLSNKQDVAYVAKTVAMWSEKFIPKNKMPATPTVEVTAGELVITDPYEHLLAALGACTTMII